MNNQKEYFETYKRKLFNLLVHCKENVPYYRDNLKFEMPEYNNFTLEFFEENINLLEKRIVRENSRQFLVDNIKEHELSIDSTSGTEGKPIICYRTKKERIYCSKSIWKERRKFVNHLRPSDKFARFYAFRNKGMDIITDEILYKDNDILLPLFNLSDNKLIKYWKEIVKFKPRWLHGPSSTIYNLALAVKKYNLEFYKFEFIELSGEYVNKEHRELIEAIFKCKIGNHYGCREYWPLAYSNNEGVLEVITDNIFIEKIYNKEHGKNELVITLLKNDAWPLVRYKLEDLGEYLFYNSKILLNLERSRKADFFTLSNNRRFNAIIFSGLARFICELYEENVILQFQVFKEPGDNLVINLRLNNCSDREIMNKYKSEVKKIVGDDVNIIINRVDFILPDEKTGKTKEFINRG